MNYTAKRVYGSRRRREVKKIYFNSFSREDRMPFFMMCIMSWLPTTKFLAYYDSDILCGFTYYAVIGRQIFLMFFAVDEALRGKGYGAGIISTLKADNPNKKIIVSIEPYSEGSDNEINRRRKEFYQRNGFNESGYMIKLGKSQELLAANGNFNRLSFRIFLAVYSLFTLWPRISRKEQKVVGE